MKAAVTWVNFELQEQNKKVYPKKISYILEEMLTKRKIFYTPLYFVMNADQTKNKQFLITPYTLG